MEICSEYWSTSRNLDIKITHNIVKTTHTVLVQVQIHNNNNNNNNNNNRFTQAHNSLTVIH